MRRRFDSQTLPRLQLFIGFDELAIVAATLLGQRFGARAVASGLRNWLAAVFVAWLANPVVIVGFPRACGFAGAIILRNRKKRKIREERLCQNQCAFVNTR